MSHHGAQHAGVLVPWANSARPSRKIAVSASSSATCSRPLRQASKASATSPLSRQNSKGTSVVLKPFVSLFSQASFCADLISTASPPAPGHTALPGNPPAAEGQKKPGGRPGMARYLRRVVDRHVHKHARPVGNRPAGNRHLCITRRNSPTRTTVTTCGESERLWTVLTRKISENFESPRTVAGHPLQALAGVRLNRPLRRRVTIRLPPGRESCVCPLVRRFAVHRASTVAGIRGKRQRRGQRCLCHDRPNRSRGGSRCFVGTGSHAKSQC
jgi:hypothetical protein